MCNVSGKTKDNEKARMNMLLYYKRLEIELQLLPNNFIFVYNFMFLLKLEAQNPK